MTDRVKGLTIVLEKDTRDDDVEALVNAIKQLRNVIKVVPVLVTGADFIDRERIKNELWVKMIKVLDEE